LRRPNPQHQVIGARIANNHTAGDRHDLGLYCSGCKETCRREECRSVNDISGREAAELDFEAVARLSGVVDDIEIAQAAVNRLGTRPAKGNARKRQHDEWDGQARWQNGLRGCARREQFMVCLLLLVGGVVCHAAMFQQSMRQAGTGGDLGDRRELPPA